MKVRGKKRNRVEEVSDANSLGGMQESKKTDDENSFCIT